ncbi:MAG: HEAT repeat domain-containing protein, partial [Synechococcus sp.]|nr:HEAT repeat domain-containing protein [Synechococcus sp.]
MPSPNDLNLIDETLGEASQTNASTEAMLGLLEAADKTQRMIAARYFCDHRDDRAVMPLIELLQRDVCPLTRVSAAYALGRNASADAVPALIDVLEQDWNGYVRKGVVWALGNCGDRRSVDPLIHALEHDISAVRLWAASSLAQVAKLQYEDVSR